jgi:hypothetical protein
MNTHFALLARFGDVNIPLDKCCEDFFALSPKKAAEAANKQGLPVPAFRLGSNKSQWFLDAKKLAEYIDSKKTQAQDEWESIRY